MARHFKQPLFHRGPFAVRICAARSALLVLTERGLDKVCHGDAKGANILYASGEGGQGQNVGILHLMAPFFSCAGDEPRRS